MISKSAGGADEEKGGGKGAGEETPPSPAPEPLTAEALVIPEGVTADEATMGSFLEIMNNQEFTPAERAQALVDLQAQTFTNYATAMNEAWTAQQQAWVDAARALPQIGGDNLNGTLERIDGMIRNVIPDKTERADLMQALDMTGFGNHPIAIKLLAAVAEQLAEPTPAKAGGQSTSGPDLSSLYPTMNKG